MWKDDNLLLSLFVLCLVDRALAWNAVHLFKSNLAFSCNPLRRRFRAAGVWRGCPMFCLSGPPSMPTSIPAPTDSGITTMSFLNGLSKAAGISFSTASRPCLGGRPRRVMDFARARLGSRSLGCITCRPPTALAGIAAAAYLQCDLHWTSTGVKILTALTMSSHVTVAAITRYVKSQSRLHMLSVAAPSIWSSSRLPQH